MAFDGIVTKSVIDELTPLIGGKIDKIHEPNKDTLILGIYSQGKNFALNICISPRNYRINLSTHSHVNPLVAPNFCMLLRKYLIGARISRIFMNGLERIVNIELETINEFNEIEVKTLIVELMGKHSNVILVDNNNKIIAPMKYISSENAEREIIPSRYYLLPSSNKFDFTAIKSFEEFYAKFTNISFDELAKSIVDTFTGFSLSFVQTSISKCNIKNISKEDLEKLYNYFCKILKNPSDLRFEKIYKNSQVSDYVLTLDSPTSEQFKLNDFIDDFYFERETFEEFTTQKNNALKKVLDLLKKYNERLLNINTKLKECEGMDEYRIYGELITANLYRIPNTHSSKIEIENYYDNNKLISISVDPKYSPNVNAKRFFKKYSKLKNASIIVTEQKIETEKEINYLDSIVYELENSSTLNNVQEILDEIDENLFFRVKSKGKKNKNIKKIKQHSFSPIEYTIDGFKIYVGKNNKENDWLTFSFANKNDIWFHTKDIQGSHVILKSNKNINDDILVKCAEIAAEHSKAKFSSNVPVDYCFVKFVKKPNNSKPGMVIFTNNKTLNVQPKNEKK